MEENKMVNEEMNEQEIVPTEEAEYGIGAIVLVGALAVGGVFLLAKGIQKGYAYAKKRFSKPEDCEIVECEATESQEEETKE